MLFRSHAPAETGAMPNKMLSGSGTNWSRASEAAATGIAIAAAERFLESAQVTLDTAAIASSASRDHSPVLPSGMGAQTTAADNSPATIRSTTGNFPSRDTARRRMTDGPSHTLTAAAIGVASNGRRESWRHQP